MNWNIEWECIIQNNFANIIDMSRFDVVVFQCDVEIKKTMSN